MQEKLFFPPFSLQPMFIHEMSQTRILITIYILFLWALQSCFWYWDTRYWCYGFTRKAFPSAIFLIFNGRPWNGTNHDTCNNLHFFCYGHYNHVLHIANTRYWCFGFVGKAFRSTIFPIINYYPWDETNLDSRNNPYCFCYGHYNHVLHIGIHNIDALV